MKKSIKKLLSLGLVTVMVASLFAGCGKKDSDSSSSNDKFYIGSIGPITGAAAQYGECVMNSAQIAVDEINANGGINGYQVEFKFIDDANVVETAVSAYNTLKDWGMQILMGTVTTQPCMSVAELTEIDEMFQITPSASSTSVIEGNTNVFQVCFTDPNQGSASAVYIGENSLASKVAVIYDSSSDYSSGIYQSFTEEAENQDFEVVYSGAFTSDSNKDFSVQLQAAMDAGAELLFLPIYYTEASLILTQADAMGYDPVIFGVDGMDGILTVENFDTSLAEDVLLLTPFAADATDDLTVNFVTKYEELYGETPNQFGADAYDAIYIIKAALESANATPDMDIDELCEKLVAAITSISVDGLTGKDMQWSANGAVNKAPKAVVIKNGTYVSFDASSYSTASEE